MKEQSVPASEASQNARYRLLSRGDLIERGDEGLNDDCETWHLVTGIFVGMRFEPNFFVPMRRPVQQTGQVALPE